MQWEQRLFSTLGTTESNQDYLQGLVPLLQSALQILRRSSHSCLPFPILEFLPVRDCFKVTRTSVTVKVGTKKVNKKTITSKEGSSRKIKLAFTPNRSGIRKTYKSSNNRIVSVDQTGRLKAKEMGTAKITVTVSGNTIPKTELWFKVKVIRQNVSDKKTGTPVVLGVNGQTFQAVFYDNRTADELLKKMPMSLDMKELNGNEKYHFFDTEFPADEKSPGKISAGDIMLYGSDCLVTFYKSHSTSYQYTPVEKIENASGFAEAVGSGTVTITYSR